MAEFKVKNGVNVHKVIPNFGGIDINEKMPKKLIDVCIAADITEYFEEVSEELKLPKTDGKTTGKPNGGSAGSTAITE